ncbi:hypothetical protein CYMTET_6935 [Cymbomonas tetramitiformis]|uniref:Uncharacterized protein n=1 Tax=Cymbomonas tetramitiformis TaxID=36881 RepID=A0AAE0GWH3_9CHLO|nr:hypothetical protein CYMTET_6935 [Cymbomonas tetramitiformis]
MREVDKQTETEIVVADSGSALDPEFDIEALAYSEGATDKEDIASYTRLRQLYQGRLYSFITLEEAYRWLVGQECSQAKVHLEHTGMYFLIRPSDFSKQGKRSRWGRHTRTESIARGDAVVQALETKLGSFADAVTAAASNRGGGITGDAETAILDLGKQVKGLSENKVEKGFKETVDNVKKDKHLALADKQNRVADAMLQRLIVTNGGTRTPAVYVPKREAKRGVASDTGDDTDNYGAHPARVGTAEEDP